MRGLSILAVGSVTLLFILLSLGNTVAISSCSDGINNSGTFTLTTNISSNTSCLVINASDVLLDCAGNYINFGGDGGSSKSAIKINPGFMRITIRNCNIYKNGTLGSFYYGINAAVSGWNHTIINNSIYLAGADYLYTILFNASSFGLT
ncbi:MAG: hypothetical protein WCP89_02395, partial [archaeon]